ncbi:MAG: 4-oxalocrotonate tautomerase family protein [Rhodospirillales bacterium]|jgi:4-oxalocrotonate tautomerase|nr:4-oxalocrotonate tautomerase family protein [Rhodospirillales bacterium]MDP6884154.1 4-oxalocrotonate tautomerase family protein [Rhodospirillales bacterium]
MPYVHVQLIEGRDDETKRKIGLAITEALGTYANAPAETCSIVFQDFNANHWMSGGQTIADKRKAK